MYEDFPNLLTAVEQVERDGVLSPLTPGAFSGYTHRPQDLRDELTAAHWSVDHLVSVESLAFALSDLSERSATASGREAVLAAARGHRGRPRARRYGTTPARARAPDRLGPRRSRSPPGRPPHRAARPGAWPGAGFSFGRLPRSLPLRGQPRCLRGCGDR
jgi:hypothetical protein